MDFTKPKLLLCFLLFYFLLFFVACSANIDNEKQSVEVPSLPPKKISKLQQARFDSINREIFQSSVYKNEGVFSTEWQIHLDKALAKDPANAYLWQQKAMPLFKQGKYELGMPFLDKAVEHAPDEHQAYRAFMKCIFAKRYRDAIEDFEDCMSRHGDAYVMDHSFSFYIAISYIQLNQFAKAEALLAKELKRQAGARENDLVHHLDLYYLGICQFERNRFEEAIATFDRAIELYPQFSDALYYKTLSLQKLGDNEEAASVYKKAEEYGKKGYSINEDNSIYERYPYQIRWH